MYDHGRHNEDDAFDARTTRVGASPADLLAVEPNVGSNWFVLSQAAYGQFCGVIQRHAVRGSIARPGGGALLCYARPASEVRLAVPARS